MSDRQLLFIIILISFVTFAVVLEVAENHVSKDDLFVVAGFLAGAGAVISIMKLGGKDGDD